MNPEATPYRADELTDDDLDGVRGGTMQISMIPFFFPKNTIPQMARAEPEDATARVAAFRGSAFSLIQEMRQ